MSLYTNRHRPPRPSAAAAALRYDCSMLPDDETIFAVPHDQRRRFSAADHHYGGDRTPAPEFSDLNNQSFFPHYNHHLFLSDSTVILNVLRRRISGGGGVAEEAIARHVESRVHLRQNDGVSGEDGLCVVCQDEFLDGRIARLDCGHEYHLDCIKRWLNLNNTCPLCKATVLHPSSHN